MRSRGTLLLGQRHVSELLSLDACITAVEQAFRLQTEGKVPPPRFLGFPAPDGGFHIKAAAMRPYFAAKTNGNFPLNRGRFGMPTIQGVIVLCDGDNGSPLALLDSIAITTLRTGAATAVAARYLARPSSATASICGCGQQGRIQLRALTRVLRLERAFAYDIDPAAAGRVAREMSEVTGLEVVAVADLEDAILRSDVCVTCTPSQHPFVRPGFVPPGLFLAAVGADSEEKQELDSRILAAATVVVDVLDQCATIGELHHAVREGIMAEDAVHAELGEVVAGRKVGRSFPDEVIVFDSTGSALQDLAAAAIVYEKASTAGIGETFEFGV